MLVHQWSSRVGDRCEELCRGTTKSQALTRPVAETRRPVAGKTAASIASSPFRTRNMQPQAINEAAELIAALFASGSRRDDLPTACRPASRAEGYAVQAEVVHQLGQRPVGWKIAATSMAGQKHINVDGPLAGRLLVNRVFAAGSEAANSIDLRGNLLRVAEAEFAFRMARTLPPQANGQRYVVDEVMAAVDSLHLAIEVPDTRFNDFVKVGAPTLIADLACASWWVVGSAVTIDWRSIDLAAHRVTASDAGRTVAEGIGANVFGDPRIALTWLANELCTYGNGLQAGDFITTGTCVVPVPCAVSKLICTVK